MKKHQAVQTEEKKQKSESKQQKTVSGGLVHTAAVPSTFRPSLRQIIHLLGEFAEKKSANDGEDGGRQ